MSRSPRISLGTLVDLSTRITQDKTVSDTSLRQRDRAIGQQLASLKQQPARQLAAWLGHVEKGQRSFGEHVQRACQGALLIFGVVGLLLGWASAEAVFWYDGSQPVNVLAVLSAYVVLPILLLTLTGWGMLRLGLGTQKTFGAISPGRLLLVLMQRLPGAGEAREKWETLLGQMARQRAVFGRVQKWLMWGAAQTFAAAFFLGVVLAAIRLIVFSDLAFGWSTTLRPSTGQVAAWVQTLAWPWSAWWEQARPSSELVALTRYFRAQSELPANVAAWGGWWPFLLACLIFYALLPRAVLLGVARWRFRVALVEALGNMPGSQQIRDRMNQPWIETRATSPTESLASENEIDTRVAPVSIQPGSIIVNWSCFPVEDAQLQTHMGDESITTFHAGGTASLADDQQVVAQVCQGHASQAVRVLVKAWEPPTGELMDFIADLRQAIGRGVPIEVIPAQINLKAGDPSQMHQWQHAIHKQGDPWLEVRAMLQPQGETS